MLGPYASLLVLTLAGCAGCTTAHPVALGALVPDFALPDLNPASSTAGRAVSPRDYLTRVSAWYFGHAT